MSTATTASDTVFAFRLVVRGTRADGTRIRRVCMHVAPSYEAAWADFAEIYPAMVKGLSKPSYSVLPPIGWRVDGTLSRGYETAS